MNETKYLWKKTNICGKYGIKLIINIFVKLINTSDHSNIIEHNTEIYMVHELRIHREIIFVQDEYIIIFQI